MGGTGHDGNVSKNTGKPYEKLTQRVFQAILDQESEVETTTVEHDVTLPGITAKSHQVDVLWRFKRGGIGHMVVVQCKDHDAKVKQGELLTFKAVLDDIAGQPRGVFVSRMGFQSGARDYAGAHGITLYELRKPLERDWKGRIRNIETQFWLSVPSFRNLFLKLDEPWFRAQLEAKSLPAQTVLPSFTSSGDDAFEDETGAVVATLHKLANKLASDATPDWSTRSYAFSSPTFFRSLDVNFARIKVTGFDLDVKKSRSKGPLVSIRGDDIVSCILVDVLEGERQAFDNDVIPLGKRGGETDGHK